MTHFLIVTIAPMLVAATASAVIAEDPPAPLRVGMIGLDTSHVVAFTKAMHDPNAPPGLRGVRVVAAFPGGSPDLPTSRDRIEGFTRALREEQGVEIVGSIAELLPKVDAVLLESVDGRPHLEQARPVLEAGKPLFIDKPVAASLEDTIRIFELAKEHGTPCFSSSSLRFAPEVVALSDVGSLGGIRSAEAWGPCSLIEHHPDLFYYGIHGVEALYAMMGTGCESVARTATSGTDVVTGIWGDGRIGTYRGLREVKAGFGVLAFGRDGLVHKDVNAGYEPLLAEVVEFFRTKQPPVTAEETIELVAFMTAAEESKKRGGTPVSIAEVIKQARRRIPPGAAAR